MPTTKSTPDKGLRARSILPFAASIFVLAAIAGIAQSAERDSSDAASLAEEKAARLAVDSPNPPPDYAEWKANVLANNPSPTSTFTPGPEDQYLVTGIIDSGAGPFSPERFAMTNRWQEVIDDTLVQVWAGNYANDQGSGLLLVSRFADWAETGNTDDEHATTEAIDAPKGAGSLKILGWKGAVLDLVSASGERFQFNTSTDEISAA